MIFINQSPSRDCGIYKLLREALYPSGSEEKLSASSSFLRKIIDFCERHLEGASWLLYVGSLGLTFRVI